jgi:hypothetical protein
MVTSLQRQQPEAILNSYKKSSQVTKSDLRKFDSGLATLKREATIATDARQVTHSRDLQDSLYHVPRARAELASWPIILQLGLCRRMLPGELLLGAEKGLVRQHAAQPGLHVQQLLQLKKLERLERRQQACLQAEETLARRWTQTPI